MVSTAPSSTDVAYWLHFSDVPGRPDDVRSRGKTGSGLPTAKMTTTTDAKSGTIIAIVCWLFALWTLSLDGFDRLRSFPPC
jgi:hypothetical protein